MISFKKSKSHLIAAIGTILIHLLLAGLLSIRFSGEESSSLSDIDNLELRLEDLAAEEISLLPPPGQNQLANQNDKTSESLSKEKGTRKSSKATPPAEQTLAEQEPQELVIPEKIEVKKKDLVLQKKPDSVQQAQKDSIVQAEIAKFEKKINRTQTNDEIAKGRARYEFYKKNTRNILNFKKVYPYALKTKQIIDSLNARLSTMTSESEKKKLIKDTEKMLFREYENAIRTMSTSQGRLLLKLISRETNETGYNIIKDYKGTIPASFWYGVGKLFGTDLKTEFHKEKEDSLIETIVTKYKDNDLY